ncbi:ATP-dependent RecD-like DNA helicase [compost metagenome]
MDDIVQPFTPQEETQPKEVKILATLVAKLNLADFQNAIPVIRELRISNETSDRFVNAALTLTSEPEVFKSKIWRIDEIAADSFRVIPGLDLVLDGPLLNRLTEAELSTFTFILETDDKEGEHGRKEIARFEQVVDLLPRNQWGGLWHIPDMTAAFVQPNDPAVERLLKQTAELLRLSDKPSSLNGYEGGSKRAWQLASAVWGAVARMKLDYALPPASFEQSGQKVRSPSQITDTGLATCLDLTLLFCAALEQIGLNPVIVFTRGHAFAGLWLKPEEFTTALIDDVTAVRKRVKLQELVLFETTLITQNPIPSFSYAVERGAKQIAEDAESDFQMLLDIRRARLQRIKPLASSEAQIARVVTEVTDEAPPLLVEEGVGFSEETVEVQVEDLSKLDPADRLGRWQRKLLDLSLRNNLLNFKTGKRALKLESPDPGALEDILASGQSLKLLTRPDLMDGADPRERALYEQREREDVRRRHAEDALKRREVFVALTSNEMDVRLTELYRGARTALQEGGSNTLFLAIGFLSWTREDRAGQKYKAPLVLVPVTLERKSARSGFTLVLHDDEPRFNPTLIEMLRQDFELALGSLEHELPRDDSGLDIAGIWNKVGHAIKDIPGWELNEDVVLSMFSFAKYLMWKDLAENAEHLRQSPVVQHLLDTPRDSFISDTPFPEAESLDRDYGPTDVFCPLPSDSSQLAAVMAAAKGKDFVLIGPPGTGKSQTISNMIAQSIAQGRRVLFVSEKIAALDVVYRRLREIGLGEFCLELHSSKARKADVLAQLQSAWEAKGQVDSAAWEVEALRLASLRDSLNIYVERLHRRHRNGYTIYDAIGTVTSGIDEAVAPVAWPFPDMHDQKAMLELRELGDRLEVNAQAVGYSQLAGNALSGVGQAEWSTHWQQQFTQAARDVLPAVLDVQRAADRFVELSGLPFTDYTPTVLEGLTILSQALPVAAGQDWRFALRIDARAITQRLNDGCSWVEQHRDINSRLSVLWPSRVVADAKQGIDLLQQRRATSAELGPAWPEGVSDVLGQAVTLLGQVSDLKQQLSATYTDAIEALDTELLQREWKEADESFWPKSWFGMRRIAGLLAPMQTTTAEVDNGKDLATWVEIRCVRRAVDELEPGHECVAVWQGAKSAPAQLATAIKLQEAIRLQKNGAVWIDDGFQSVEQGLLGDELKEELRRLRTLVRLDAEMGALADLGSGTNYLWNGLSTDIDALTAALRFQAERREIEERGRLVDDHLHVEEGRCGESLKGDLELLKQRAAVERDLADLADLREFVPVWGDLKTKLDVARQAIAFQGQIATAVAKLALNPEQIAACKAPLQTLLGDGNALLEPEGAIALAGVLLREKLGLLQERSSQLTSIGHFTDTAIDETAHLSLNDLKKNCETVVSSEARLKAWCAWRKVRDEAFAVGLAPIVLGMESGAITSGKVRRVLEVNYARWWLNNTVDNEEVIRTFVSAEHEQRIRDFSALDDKFTELTKDWLRARLCADLPSQESVSRSSEWGLLRHEMGKKTKHLPLRELMTRAPDALTKLTPCLLMSPLSIAQYLPPASTPFDLVIFDEASQIPVWDAIGAMARGKQVVMVGDPKQLPPTSFFDRAESTADDEDVEADLESILDECISANLPMRNLNWHYRSRHESLIAFSNQRYYQSKLVTFPSPYTADKAVRLCPVAGVYDKGGSRTNLIEARYLVADLVARLQSPAFRESRRTAGVVTFNGEQQKLIMDMLDDACRKDPSLDSYFAESELEPVFVKNLESVQGDERDIIYFSTTYGKDAAGVMSMNFGPMNRPGGERRLNVAITRARQELVVFSTLRPEHIDLARTQAIGVRDLKHFLEFAERGPRALAEANFGSVGGFDSPFEEAVAAALAKKGWQIHTQIGVSSFRVDLGVVHPDAPGRFLAGVECDGATYHRSATARDRDKLREFVLRGLGWEIVRIWSTDWWVDAAGTAEKVHQRLNLILAESREKQAVIDAVQEAERLRVDAAMAEAVEVVGQVTVIAAAAVAEATEANDPTGALPELKYARASTVAAVEDFVAFARTVEHVIYKEADPSQAVKVVDPDQFFDHSYTVTLEQMIAHVVAEEGPVLDSALARRIARAHGWVRTGSRIRDRVDQLARARFRSHEEEQTGVFFWPAHIETDASVVFRRPSDDDSSRGLAEICLPELGALVHEMVERGHEGEALIYAVAKEAGVSKLAHAGRQRIEKAIRRIVE